MGPLAALVSPGVRAAVYCRISADPRQHEAGVQQQEQDCRELAERRGWSVEAVYVDNNKSAWKRDRQRPGWDRLMAGLADKAYDAIVVWHGDRLMRQPRDLEDLLDAADHGVQLASPSSQRDLSDPDDRYILRIEVAHACRSSDDTSRRTRRAHQRLAEAGRSAGGGTRPFGFEDDRRTHHPTEAPLVRQAVQRLLAGERLRTVCADWNARGIRTVTGKEWAAFTLRTIVTSPRIAGWRSYHGQWAAPAEWEPIVDADQVRVLAAILTDPNRRVNGNARRYMLTGFAYCGLCGARLVARPRDDKRRCYVCAKGPGFKGCGKIRVLADTLEADITDRAISAFNTPAVVAAMTDIADDTIGPLLAELEAIRAREEEIADQFTGANLTGAFPTRALANLAARRAEVDAELARHVARQPVVLGVEPGDLELDAWENEMTLDQKRALLAVIEARVVVGPAVRGRNVYDESRVTFRTIHDPQLEV